MSRKKFIFSRPRGKFILFASPSSSETFLYESLDMVIQNDRRVLETMVDPVSPAVAIPFPKGEGRGISLGCKLCCVSTVFSAMEFVPHKPMKHLRRAL
jgi:hypothetical protein